MRSATDALVPWPDSAEFHGAAPVEISVNRELAALWFGLSFTPTGWEESALEAEMAVGKRCARLNVKSADGPSALHALLAETDILVHGCRSDALTGMALPHDVLRERYPQLVDVGLDAYGWSGPSDTAAPAQWW